MKHSYLLGSVLNLQISVTRSAILSFLVLWLLLALIGIIFIQLSVIESIIGGFIAAFFHYFSEFLHQLGHSIAARRTGYPMKGVRFWFIFGGSVYPRDEGDLPGSIHIRRALGGAPMSFLITLILGLVLLALGQSSGMLWWVVLFLFLDNLLVFTLGALLPIRIGDFVTDGATILYWRSR